MPKKLTGGPFGIFQHPFCRKTPKKMKDPLGKKFFGSKKSSSMPKKMKGSRPVLYVTRETPVLYVTAPTGAI